jgi:hypothetical protein
MRGPPETGVEQLLLAVAGVALVVFGLVLIAASSDAGRLVGFPLVLLGVIVLVVRAFHSRLRSLKIAEKLELILSPEPGREPEAEPPVLEAPPRQLELESRPPGLGQVSGSAAPPDTDRPGS